MKSFKRFKKSRETIPLNVQPSPYSPHTSINTFLLKVQNQLETSDLKANFLSFTLRREMISIIDNILIFPLKKNS
jgi:hypothetical protein